MSGSVDRSVVFAPDEEALREDVRSLGAMLGEVLTEQGGPELFERVEAARLAAIARREGSEVAERDLDRLLTCLSPAAAAEVVRAFSAYFSLVNMAEQVQSIRRRRAYQLDPDHPQPGSLAAVLRTLAEAGLHPDFVLDLLGQTRVVPVFTAHPTEATRRTILAKEQRVLNTLLERIPSRSTTHLERKKQEKDLLNEIGLIWQTDEQPSVQPTVADEVEHILFYVSDVIYSVVPSYYESLKAALEASYGRGAGDVLPCPIVRFGSWVGGDMDGNPNVNADTVRATLQRQRQLILDRYRTDVRRLFDHLSQSLPRASVTEAVLERCREYRNMMPAVSQQIPSRYDDMPYRVLLWLIWARVGATQEDAAGAYAGVSEFTDDLQLVADSLRANCGTRAGLPYVEDLLLRVRTFGFHLATLDIRQDAVVHRQVAGRLLGVSNFSELPAGERTVKLRNALGGTGGTVSEGRLDDLSRRTLDIMKAIAEARGRYGSEAVGPYIISMAQGPDDALAVLFLARRAGLVDGDGSVPLDIAPLFETVDDLASAHETLESLLSDRCYGEHLGSRRDQQLVMLGYSDSNKISGITASRWALYQAQERLAACADAAGIHLTVFHGRGGTVGRGGSKVRAAILADPCGAVRGRVRVTVQGEVVHLKYGMPDIAERTLELMTGAVVEATAFCDIDAALASKWVEAMNTVATAGRTAYRALVYEDPDFMTYFREATPIDVIERLKIGSRPSSRRSGKGVENLRAIPWVFAWTQSRHLLPGWYGAGAGLASARELHGEEVLRDMAQNWPFFANLLADLEMVLAKADLDIAARYAALAGAVGERFFPVIRAQFNDTARLVMQLKGTDELLDGEPVLKRSIRLRNPYVDPISLIQVDLLGRWREGGRADRELEGALFSTVRGIARGLRNTG